MFQLENLKIKDFLVSRWFRFPLPDFFSFAKVKWRNNREEKNKKNQATKNLSFRCLYYKTSRIGNRDLKE